MPVGSTPSVANTKPLTGLQPTSTDNTPVHAVDTELFIRQAFQQDPKQGCDLLFRRYHRALCSHAVRFVYSREVAEDIVSEVFCRLWRNRAYETVTTSYRAYLYRAVQHEAYTHLRLECRSLADLETAANQPTPSSQQADQLIQYNELLHRVEALIEQLSPQCRRVFLLSRFEGKRYQTIADELGLSIKTVEVHLSKALHLLRQGLTDYWLPTLLLLFQFCHWSFRSAVIGI